MGDCQALGALFAPKWDLALWEVGGQHFLFSIPQKLQEKMYFCIWCNVIQRPINIFLPQRKKSSLSFQKGSKMFQIYFFIYHAFFNSKRFHPSGPIAFFRNSKPWPCQVHYAEVTWMFDPKAKPPIFFCLLMGDTGKVSKMSWGIACIRHCGERIDKFATQKERGE